jgi:hypothetical protein
MSRQFGLTSRSAESKPELPHMKPGPSISDLKEWLDYDPLTGIFRRKKTPRNHIAAGSVAGTPGRHGYIGVRVKGPKYMAHRLAWLWVHGEWPLLLIDHIDGNKSNNRIENLRLVTNGQNAFNRGSRKGTLTLPAPSRISGGVSRERFRARIVIDGKNIHLGSFDTEAEAKACFLTAVAEAEATLQ